MRADTTEMLVRVHRVTCEAAQSSRALGTICLNFLVFQRMRRLRLKKMDQFAPSFDIVVVLSEYHCEVNPGNGRKFNTLEIEINFQSWPTMGGQI